MAAQQDNASRSYVVGTGWWCSDAPDSQVNPGRPKLGSDRQRAVSFFDVWLRNVEQVCRPDTIVVVDSASPVKPDRSLRDRTAWIELPFNARHAIDHVGQWSGWTRSVLASAQYALVADADFYVYIEQDCLIGGQDILAACTEQMDTGLMFGSGGGTPQPVQQSFFIVSRARLPGFLKNLADIKLTDAEESPEWKFVFASWRPFVIASNLGLFQRRKLRRFAFNLAQRYFFDTLPVGTGRARPIPFDEARYYFQHGTDDEISRHLEAQGV